MKDVSRFLSLGSYAVAGASRNPKKFGNIVYKRLMDKGADVVPVNPNISTFGEAVCYPTVTSLPERIKGVIIVTPSDQTLLIARETIAAGIRDIWIQPGAESKEVISELEKEDINLVHGECILMFIHPSGIHSFHRFLKKISGRLPV